MDNTTAVRGEPGYRSLEQNRAKVLVYDEGELIGSVRRGLDNKWYPELLPEKSRGAAIHAVIIAHEAIEWYRDTWRGKH